VVLCDQSGAGPLVTTGELDRLRPLNFGIRTLRDPVTAGFLASQIERYDPADAAEVSRRIRATAGIEGAVDRMTGLYEEVLAEHRRKGPPPAEEESRAAAAYLGWLSVYVAEREGLSEENAHLRQEVQTLQSTATWRLRERLLRVYPLRWAYRWVRGVGR
jgi:hypothetical protein